MLIRQNRNPSREFEGIGAPAGELSARLSSADRTRPEMGLVVACARTIIDEETGERIRALLKQPIDWEYLFQRANRHSVAPLLCVNLISHFADSLPSQFLHRLRVSLQDHARRNLSLARELTSVVKLLDENGIPVLPFKGPTLAILAYRNLSLRQFADLDILVRRRDVARAEKLLCRRGYRADGPVVRTKKIAHKLSRRKDLILVSPDGSVRFELHWRLTGRHFPFPLDEREIWSAGSTVSIAASEVRSLSPLDLLLFLCMHGSRHSWERLEWITDVAELLRVNKDLDWQQMLRRANSLGCERAVFLGLLLANDLLKAEIPVEVLNVIRADQVAILLARQVRELVLSDTDVSLDISHLRDYHLKVRERLGDRLRLQVHYYARYVQLAATLSARDRDSIRFPRSLWFLYYVIRPVRLLLQRREVRTRPANPGGATPFRPSEEGDGLEGAARRQG